MKKNKLFKGLITLYYASRGIIAFMLFVILYGWYCAIFKRGKSLYKEYAFVCKIMLWAVGVELQIIGNKIPKDKKCIVPANHTSVFDPFLAGAYFGGEPAIAIVHKKLFNWYYFLGVWLKGTNTIPFDRENNDERKKILRTIAKILQEKKYHLFIFPEGTRSTTGEMGTFEVAVFKMAIIYGVDIFPISIVGAFEFSNKTTIFLNPGPVLLINKIIFKIKKYNEAQNLSDVVKRQIQHQKNNYRTA